MLRVLLYAGLSLMLVGFGAAGWQYWEDMSRPVGAAGETLPGADNGHDQQGWLISPLGRSADPADVRAYLTQDRAVAERTLRVTMTADLADLLQDGEALPDPAYLEVMADIRAVRLAEGLCPELLSTIADRCAVASARVVPGSVDVLQGSARFAVELAYAVKPDPAGLPDLALHVFETRVVALPDGNVASGQSVSSALRMLLDQAGLACADPEGGLSCRVLRLTLDHDPTGRVAGSAVLGSLRPLPETMRIVPEITPLPKQTPAPEG